MGVIKHNNKPVSFDSSDDAELIESSILSSITFSRFLNRTHSSPDESTHNRAFSDPVIVSSEDEQTPARNGDDLLGFIDSELRRSRRSTTSNKKRKIVRAQPSFVCLGVKGKSDKKKKRFDNANMLANPYLKCLINDADIYKELDIHDFAPKSLSPFALLLMDQNNMKAWNEFVKLPQEEQETVLHELENEEKTQNPYKKKHQKELSDKKFESQSNVEEGKCKKSVHSSKKCFERINSCIKSVLRKKIPLNLMESIENELLLHFNSDPTCAYQTCLDSSYSRLLLHACAQFYDLNCRSFDAQNGDRWSEVSIKTNKFEPSIDSLTAHLEKLYFESSRR